MRDFFPYHPLKLRAVLVTASVMCVVLLAWALSSAVRSQAPIEMARAGLCLGLQLAMAYVLMKLAPRDGWGVKLEGTVLKVSRPIDGVLEVPWSAVQDVRKNGRDTLVLFVGDRRRILLPRHLFGSRETFEELVKAIEERLPAPTHDA
ncbi:MAG: YcxB family protein [Archangiaceae bacterium]|nr:YcxB family protein [Archangiaceae bacterium]